MQVFPLVCSLSVQICFLLSGFGNLWILISTQNDATVRGESNIYKYLLLL